MKITRKRCADLYLIWLNDFVTLRGFTKYYELSKLRALRVIKLGKAQHEKNVREYKNETAEIREGLKQ